MKPCNTGRALGAVSAGKRGRNIGRMLGLALTVSAALLLSWVAPAEGGSGTGREPWTSVAPPKPGGTGWGATATHLRGQNGSRFSYSCPAGGSARTVWGTGVYTDDSSVCTAAVHARRIGLARGGTVTIEIRPGLSSYEGTTRNGISTRSYGSWRGSFVFV